MIIGQCLPDQTDHYSPWLPKQEQHGEVGPLVWEVDDEGLDFRTGEVRRDYEARFRWETQTGPRRGTPPLPAASRPPVRYKYGSSTPRNA